VKISLANPEPSTHGTPRRGELFDTMTSSWRAGQQNSAIGTIGLTVVAKLRINTISRSKGLAIMSMETTPVKA